MSTAVSEGSGGSPVGGRRRIIRYSGVPVNQKCCNIYFEADSFISLQPKSFYFNSTLAVPLSIKVSRNTGNGPIMLDNQENSSWELDFVISFYLDGRLISDSACVLNGKQSFFDFSPKLPENKLVNIQLEFNHIHGFGVKPLRYYHVSYPNSDVALVVGGKKFYVVKEMFGQESSFFKRLFNAPFYETNQLEIAISDISPETMTAILDILDGQFYHPPDKEATSNILEKAHSFGLSSIASSIEHYIFTIPQYGALESLDYWEKLLLADKYGMDILLDLLLGKYHKRLRPLLTKQIFAELSRDMTFEILKRGQDPLSSTSWDSVFPALFFLASLIWTIFYTYEVIFALCLVLIFESLSAFLRYVSKR